MQALHTVPQPPPPAPRPWRQFSTLNDMRSIMWKTPMVSVFSYRDPASTTSPTVQNAPGEFSDATRNPEGSVLMSVRIALLASLPCVCPSRCLVWFVCLTLC
jgi:hypothetical protein